MYDPTVSPVRPARSDTTRAAVVGHFVVTAGAALLLLALVVSGGLTSISDTDADGDGDLLVIVVAIFSGIIGLMIVLGVAVLKLRPWARWALIGVYGFHALPIVVEIADTGRGPAVGTAGLFASIAMIALLLLPSTAEDFRGKSQRSVAPQEDTPFLAPGA